VKRVAIGIAIYPGDGDSQNTVFSHALHALWVAKQKGRSTYQFYEPGLQQLSLREHAMQQMVQDERLFERLSLHFHPIHIIGDQQILALAVTLGWPEALATVSADEWVRVVAAQNRLVPIMIWQLEQACKQFLARGSQYKHVRYLVVSLPVVLLKNTRFVHGLAQWLMKWHFDPKQLWLRIYGDFHIIPLEDFEKAANMLKYLNVGLIVDQRGDQVLPFHYFLNAPFTYYHLTDKIFSDHMDSPRVQSMLNAVSLFMNQLSIQLIVSGVYTESELTLLKQFGVSLVLDQSEALFIAAVTDTV
jgi:EAL domain-containing protein (putative c-di-GMP-specific phosphodiesterase class I)